MDCKGILVVEDDVDIRKQVLLALKDEGYKRIMSAGNGIQAFKILSELSDEDLPGCIILDLMMPEMDGITFMETIENIHKDRYGGIKVIVATAKGSPINPEKIPNAVERIQKPFDLDELYRVVELHCGKPY